MWIGWGTFTQSTDYAFSLMQAYALGGEARYWDNALLNLNTQLGANPLSLSFITGVGARYPRDPLHLPSIFDGIDEPVPGIPVFGPKAHISNAYGHHRAIQDDANSYPYSVNVGDPYPILRRYVDNNNIPPYSEFSIQEMARTIGALTMVGRASGTNQPGDTTPADWVNTDVTVKLVATDNESGVASIYYCTDQNNTCEPALLTSCAGLKCEAEVTITQEGIHFTRYYAIDNAGNVEVVRSREVRMDKTPPTITSSRDIAPNANDWNNTDVTVSYVASDALSGIDQGASDIADDVLGSEGPGQSASGTAVDNAGNSASATVSNINIDKTAPTVTINTPADGSIFDFGDLVLADYTVDDSLSGSDGIAGTVPNGDPIDTAGVGTLTFMVSATDLAGNTTTVTHSYQVLGLREIKQEVMDQLIPFASTSEDIEKAIERMGRSLKATFWLDELHLDLKEGNHVFDRERQAVKELFEALEEDEEEDNDEEGLSPDARTAAEAAIDRLVKVDRLLAQLLLDENQGLTAVDLKKQDKVDRETARAQEEFDKGDAALDADRPEKAVKHYRKAWDRVTKAIKESQKIPDDKDDKDDKDDEDEVDD